MKDIPQQAYAVFQQILDMSPARTELYLQKACGENGPLLREVRAFLADYQILKAKPFLEKPLLGTLMPTLLEEAPKEGQLIGNYRLERELGRGGMGRVFLAEQLRPVQRRVALKFLMGPLTGEVARAYFLKERQVLARLENHYIARIYDAGVTEANAPFFAMEYVDGRPLTEYCREETPKIKDRINLFLKVCEGVFYAHQKGIIHRDLKPDNILIKEEEGQAVPKLIDFGISRVVGDHGDGGLYTRHSLIAGTPLYMSPEQAGWSRADVDSRTDIYALGMVLYELLAEGPPLDAAFLSGKNGREQQYLLFQKEMPLPSLRVLMSANSQQERNEVKSRARLLAGDLDWIVSRALARNPENRYASVNELREDLQHYLNGGSNLSRPTSTWYRLIKFSRRHRFSVNLGAMVLFAVLIGMLGLALGLRRARSAESRALAEAERANHTLGLIEKMLTTPGPGTKTGETKAIDVLQTFAQRNDWQRETPPDDRAILHHLIGKTLSSLGDYEKGKHHLKRAFDLLNTHDKSETRRHLEVSLHYWEARLFAGEESGLLKAVTDGEKLAEETLGPADALTIQYTRHLADIHAYHGEYQIAEDLISSRLAAAAMGRNDSGLHLLNLKQDLAALLSRKGEYQKSLDLLQNLVTCYDRKGGLKSVRTLEARQNLGLVYLRLERFEDALRTFNKNLIFEYKVFGQGHPFPLRTKRFQVLTLLMMKRFQESIQSAESLYEEVIRERGEKDRETCEVLHLLGNGYFKNEQYCSAIATYRKALALYEEIYGSKSIATISTRINLGIALFEVGNWPQAKPLVSQSLKVCLAELDEQHPYSLAAKSLWAEIQLAMGENHKAALFAEQVLAIDKNYGNAWRVLGRIALTTGQGKRAMLYLEKAYQIQPDDQETQALRLQAMALLAQSNRIPTTQEQWTELPKKHGDALPRSKKTKSRQTQELTKGRNGQAQLTRINDLTLTQMEGLFSLLEANL